YSSAFSKQRYYLHVGPSLISAPCRDSNTRRCHYSAPSVAADTINHPEPLPQRRSHISPSQANHILKSNEYSFKAYGQDGRNAGSVLRFDSNVLASNWPMEDRRSTAMCLQSKAMLFGVFDGHAGYTCAQAVSERLFYYIAVSLLRLKVLEDIEEAVENERPVMPVLQWHKHPNDHASTDELIELGEDRNRDTQTALVDAFKRLDSDIALEAQADFGELVSRYMPLRTALSGCTACVAHLDGPDLHVANLGDSRAVIGVQEEDGTWSALTVTNDHNAENPEEVQRVLSKHPATEEKTVVKHGRLLGLLMPFRAFGDVRFKWSGELLKRVCETRPGVLPGIEFSKMLPPNYHTPPYLTAEPEVTHHRLRPQDKFLILATDGLWELMHRQSVVQVVGEHLSGAHWQKPVSGLSFTLGQMLRLLVERRVRALSALEDENAATHLLRHALGSDGFGAVDPRRLAKMLSLPPELTRMYRDDIAVVVNFEINFNQEFFTKSNPD
uniref:[Pyruvate dehydrogenase [acetyl-transferring]]-phosphatase 2, mitochondrial n=1 Tax=Scleropages formosus TaxID=113540 RepID=A0A8C9R5A9_SCLFO